MFSNLIGDGKLGGILALVIGLCVLGLVIIYVWRAFGRGIRAAAPRGARQPRLGIVDAFDLDRHRQLVLVRRDNVEHLIMIGGPNDLLIEGEIVRAQPSGVERREPSAAPASGQGERQPPRLPIDAVTSGPAPTPSPAPPAPQPAPSLDVKPPQEPAQSPPIAPPLRPTLDQPASEPVAPPPPLSRPAPPASVGPRPMPQRPLPTSVRPPPPSPSAGPSVMPPAPRPGAPTLAQRPVTPPTVAPPPPPINPPAPERAPAPARDAAPEPARETPRLSVNIDSLEEEMAKLLNRPMDPPRS